MGVHKNWCYAEVLFIRKNRFCRGNSARNARIAF